MNKEFDKERVDRFWNDGVATKNWLYGYFEAEVSFGIYLNTRGERKKRYFNFKPFITIQSEDKEVIEHIKKILNLYTNITNSSSLYYLKIQKTKKNNDIDKIIDLLKNYKFISQKKQGIFDRFKDAYFEILKIGLSWTEYDKKIEDFINNYLPIQNSTKKTYSNKEWINKIKNHFIGDEENDT